MEKQNITLSIPKTLLKKAKILAVEQNTSLSALLAGYLEKIVAAEENYQSARQSHRRILRDAPDLGTGGSLSWSRDELHER